MASCAVRFVGQRVVLVSNERWGEVWFSKHHYAAALAQANDVVFVDPPSPWRPGRTVPHLANVDGIPRLRLLTYGNALPLSGRLRSLFFANDRIVAKRLLAVLGGAGLGPSLFWSFDPHRLVNPRLFGVRTAIYQMMDYYDVKWEPDLVANCDLVLSVSPEITARRHWSRPVLQIPHAVPAAPFDIEQLANARAGREAVLVGTFTERIEYSFLVALAEADRTCRIRLVGPVDERRLSSSDAELLGRLSRSPNVEFVGVPSQRDLPREILRATLGLCAYKKSAPGNVLNSHKVLQYLSLGKPVVSTPLASHCGTPRALVELAESSDEFVRACLRRLDEGDTAAARRTRVEYAAEFSHDRVLARIEGLLRQRSGI